MDDILARIFNSPPGNSTIPSEDASRESFLPRLQFMECTTSCGTAPFSWNHIPQLYRQGHRRSLTLKSAAKESHISDETALQLLKLTDEGVDLQILDTTTKPVGIFSRILGRRFVAFLPRFIATEIVLLELFWNILHVLGTAYSVIRVSHDLACRTRI
jgi:hypothetical protein